MLFRSKYENKIFILNFVFFYSFGLNSAYASNNASSNAKTPVLYLGKMGYFSNDVSTGFVEINPSNDLTYLIYSSRFLYF